MKEMYKVETLIKRRSGDYIINLGLSKNNILPVKRFIFDQKMIDTKDLLFYEHKCLHEIEDILYEEYKAGDKSALVVDEYNKNGYRIPMDKIRLCLFMTNSDSIESLISVINLTMSYDIQLRLYRYDESTGECFTEDVLLNNSAWYAKDDNIKYNIDLDMCKGKHPIFNKDDIEKNVNNSVYMESKVYLKIKDIINNDKSCEENQDLSEIPENEVHLNLYTTNDLNPITVVYVINLCRMKRIKLTVFCYKLTGEYYPKDVL